MGKPILYGSIFSPPVRTVLLTAKAIHLDLEFKEVDVRNKEHLSDEFLRKNPQHTIPVLEDNGRCIWDSHAIATYLIGKYGKDDSLYPKDIYQRARVDQRLHFDSGVLFPRIKSIADMIFFKSDPNIPKEKIDAICEGYDFLEKFLESGDYLVDNSVTVADFCCIATITTIEGIVSIDPIKYPQITAWKQRMAQLPYYQEANGNGAALIVKLFQDKLAELKGK